MITFLDLPAEIKQYIFDDLVRSIIRSKDEDTIKASLDHVMEALHQSVETVEALLQQHLERSLTKAASRNRELEQYFFAYFEDGVDADIST